MKIIWEGIQQAFVLLFTGNRDIIEIILLTLRVSGIAVVISMFLGIVVGFSVGISNFRGKRIIISFINTGMGLPPVAAGLFVAIFLWRSGPLGFLKLMYTPTAMIIAQVIISTPIIAGVTLAAIQQINPRLRMQAISLGASRFATLWILAKEARLQTLAAIMAGFGGIISEVGAVTMVGGNIKGYTQTLTTATVQMVRMGQLAVAIALVIILLVISFTINSVLTAIQQKENKTWMQRYLK